MLKFYNMHINDFDLFYNVINYFKHYVYSIKCIVNICTLYICSPGFGTINNNTLLKLLINFIYPNQICLIIKLNDLKQ